MKVWVVLRPEVLDWDGVCIHSSDVYGVFSSKENAEKAVKDITKFYWAKTDLKIEECSVDTVISC